MLGGYALIDLVLVALVELEAGLKQLVLEVGQHIRSILIRGEGVYELGAMLAVEDYLVVDGTLITFLLLAGIHRVMPILAYAEMLDVGYLAPLPDGEIWGIGFIRLQDVVLIGRFVLVVDSV